MSETRVNIRHLLEDLRDSYPYPLEEAIVTELIANALDSRASTIRMQTDIGRGEFLCLDDGEGMTRGQLENFHDIAATTKVRGKGIGFAGVGVKLALLVGTVRTESKLGEQQYHGTRWHLENDMHAPWEFVDISGVLSSYPRGTAVRISVKNSRSDLLSKEFLEGVIQSHFHPMLDPQFAPILSGYKGGIKVYVNGTVVEPSSGQFPDQPKFFTVRLRRKQVGIGYVCKSTQELDEKTSGVAISTYGKVIKRGWDWLKILPKDPSHVTGIVEVPDLAEILTMNKCDFLGDGKSRFKFLEYRKEIQKAINPALRELGQIDEPSKQEEKKFRHIERDLEKVLEKLIHNFPELSALLGKQRKGEPVKGVIKDPESPLYGTSVQGSAPMSGDLGAGGKGGSIQAAPGLSPEGRIEPNPNPIEPGRPHEGRSRRPGLMLGFRNEPNRPDLGWIEGEVIFINEGHPAFKKCRHTAMEHYHIPVSVAWVLSTCLEEEKSPQGFINDFLSAWAAGV